MCIIIVQPSNTNLPITKEEFDAHAYKNPDGFGIMYAQNGQLHIFKSLKNKPVWKKYKWATNRKLPLCLHFRIGTSGQKDIVNCHPFLVSDNVGLMHNGVLSCVHGNKTECDSLLLTKLLHEMPVEYFNNKTVIELLRMAIGTTNKLVLMDNNGQCIIVNESKGKWEDGRWYSQTTFSKTIPTFKPINYPKSFDDYIDNIRRLRYTPGPQNPYATQHNTNTKYCCVCGERLDTNNKCSILSNDPYLTGNTTSIEVVLCTKCIVHPRTIYSTYMYAKCYTYKNSLEDQLRFKKIFDSAKHCTRCKKSTTAKNEMLAIINTPTEQVILCHECASVPLQISQFLKHTPTYHTQQSTDQNVLSEEDWVDAYWTQDGYNMVG